MQYQEAVAEARGLVKRSEDDQWRLAELSWERSQPQRGREGLPEGKVSVSQWARDVELSESYVRDLRAVWERFGSESPRPKFKDVIIEVHSASGYEAKLERGARQALADPEAVRQAVAENPEVRQVVIDEIARDPDATDKLIRATERHQKASYSPEEREHRERSDRANEIWEETSEQYEQEHAAYQWMLRVSAELAEYHRFRIEDVMNQAQARNLRAWDRTLDGSLPFLRDLHSDIKQRLSGRLKAVEL